jgi:hypothetical protein
MAKELERLAMEIEHTRKSLPTLLREAGAPAPTFDAAAGALRYVVDGESLTAGEAAKRLLPQCGECGTAWPPCDHKRADKATPDYRVSDYLTTPDVWGDKRGDLVPRPKRADEVEIGDLFVIEDGHGHAYKVNSIDRAPEGPDILRFTCTGGPTACAYPASTVQILTPREPVVTGYSVQTKHGGDARPLLTDIPSLPLAERLVIGVMEVYGDHTAWIEEV